MKDNLRLYGEKSRNVNLSANFAHGSVSDQRTNQRLDCQLAKTSPRIPSFESFILERPANSVSRNSKGHGGNVMEYPQFGLHGQVALVTGAARGLGRAISLALAHAGADVALGLRDINADSGLAAEIRNLGRQALPLQMDMRSMPQISLAVDQAAKEFGRIDILVNNAGIAPENLAENVREE